MIAMRTKLKSVLLVILSLALMTACTAVSTPSEPEPTAPSPPTAVSQTAAESEPDPTLPPPAVVVEEEEIESATADNTAVAPTETETAIEPETEPDPEPISPDGQTDFIAYLSEGTLYIQDLAQGGDPIIVEQTLDDFTDYIAYPIWSPDGEYLLYYRAQSTPDNPSSSEIRVADRQGNWQTIGTDARTLQPAAWSPDGQQIVYLQITDEMTADQMGMILQLQLSERLPDGGGFAPAITHGTIQLPSGGCGGGGRSMSETLYDTEGGTAYGYYMGVLAWSAQGILLLTDDCANVGISRYDMNSATQLPAYENAPLRNLSLTPDKTGWVAVHGFPYEPESGQLAIGDPTAETFTILPTSAPVELAFVGQQSGDIFYTSRQAIPTGLDESKQEEGMMSFRFYETTIWRATAVDDTLTETPIFNASVHGVARLHEAPDGTVRFVWVENETEFVTALNNDTLGDDRSDYLPRRHIAALVQTEAENTAVELIANAGLLAVAP